MYPAENIRISGEGNEREIRLLPADNIVGANAMLWLTAKNASNMTYNRRVSILWQELNWLDDLEQAEALAEAQGKKIFLLIGLDGDYYTLQLHQYYCQISDVAAALQDDYILCYLQFPDQVGEVFGSGSFSLPLTAILQQEGEEWPAIFKNSPREHEWLSPTKLRTALAADPLQLRPAAQEFDFQAQSLFVQVLVQGDWTISSDSDFLQVARSSGSGRATLECVLLENFGEEERVAELTLSSGAKSRICQILQGYDPPQEIAISKGWNTLTLSVKLNAQSQQLWSTQLHAFECHKRVFTRVPEAQPGTAYLVYNGTDAEIILSGRKITGAATELPTTSGTFLQGIEENRELPSGISAWLLLEGIYLPVLNGQLEAGKAYWLYR